MSSKKSLFVPGAVYQLYNHGLFGVDTFQNTSLKEYFRDLLAKSIQDYAYKCYGWSLMNDHYHLIVKSSEIPVASFMNRFNSAISRRFNRMVGNEGVAFGSKYAGIIVQPEPYLASLSRWVHLNPVRSNLCSLHTLDSYHWSGHREIIGKSKEGIIDIPGFLEYFPGESPLKTYQNFMKSPKAETDTWLETHIRNANRKRGRITEAENWVIGDGEYTRWVFQTYGQHIPVPSYIKKNLPLQRVHETVASVMQLDKNEVLKPVRKSSASVAREIITLAATEGFGFSRKQVAEYLGVSTSVVAKMITQAKAFCEGNNFLQKICNQISEQHEERKAEATSK